MAGYCKTVGFPDPMVVELIHMQPVRFSGELYSAEHKKRFPTERSTAQIDKHPDGSGHFRLTINGTDIIQWFKQKFDELQQKLGIKPAQTPSRGRGV